MFLKQDALCTWCKETAGRKIFLEIGCTLYLEHKDSGKENFPEIGCTMYLVHRDSRKQVNGNKKRNLAYRQIQVHTFLHLFLDDSKDALGCIGTVAECGPMETTEDSCISVDPNAHILSNCTYFASIPGWLQHSVGGNICPSRVQMSKEEQNTKQKTDLLVQIIHYGYQIYIAK